MHGPRFRRVPTPIRRKPWYERDGGARLAKDRALVAASHYAGMTFSIDDANCRCVLEGDIVYASESGIQTPVSVRIVFPDEYPRQEPRAYDAADRFVHDDDGHFISDREGGRCCLWLKWETSWSADEPDALLAYLDQVALFFHRQLIFEANGRTQWPGPARDHGVRGYYDFLNEALDVGDDALRLFLPRLEQYGSYPRHGPCPCCSGRSYRECHLPRVTEIVRTVGQSELENWLAPWRRKGYPGLAPGIADPASSKGSSFTTRPSD